MIGAGVTVTLLTATTSTNRYGTTDSSFASPTSTAVAECLFAPQSSSEDNDGRTAGTRRGQLYMPAGTTVTRGQQVQIPNNGTWEIDGDPLNWSDPTGSGVQGIEVPVRKVEG